MRLEWSRRALDDLVRLHAFLSPASPRAAASLVQALVKAPTRLVEHPRLGERLDEFTPRDVRRILVGRYEMRYEVRSEAVVILRIWHTREDR